jgi:tRNA threonylcarbamoyladenosine biosynthesis protein TsaB
MNVLAFDSCFGAVSVALRWQSARGEILIREAYEERETGHAERLLPMIEEVMAGAGQSFATIDRIAVTLGPGSFTGLRIGIATARALALATKIPVVGMTSLAVMAARADHLLGTKRGTKPLIVAVDARRDHIYMETFGENAGDTRCEARLIPANTAARDLANTPVIAVGTGAAALARESSNPEHVTVMLPALQPHARFLAKLAPALKIQDDKVQPRYLRNADAKAQTRATLLKANP